MSDWAEEKAREWILSEDFCAPVDPVWLDTTTAGTTFLASLAALLREVGAGYGPADAAWENGRKAMLVEVRRVVEEVRAGMPSLTIEQALSESPASYATRLCDEIKSRLEKLDPPRLSTPEEALRVMGQGQPLVKMREIK